jgi:SAM-dependent methyltransferase
MALRVSAEEFEALKNRQIKGQPGLFKVVSGGGVAEREGEMNCNFSNTPLTHVFCDLNHQPPSNAFLTKAQLDEPEIYYPLKVYVCDSCWLVQVPNHAGDLFTDNYPYYSSQSPANVSHAKEYVDMMVERFGHGKRSKVLEIGSNDGYLLQWFKDKGCDVLGFDPAEGPAKVAIEKGIPTRTNFFGADELTRPYLRVYAGQFDLICGINVLAHQPDINDFVAGLKIALAPGGVITFEFPHLQRLAQGLQFDTIYHEHYSYFSMLTIDKVFERHGLKIFDVDELPEHGGSLRIYAKHCLERLGRWEGEKVRGLIEREKAVGMDGLVWYLGFQSKVEKVRRDVMEFLYGQSEDSFVMGYGAAAKGNTFLNFCGIKDDLVRAVVDRSPHKQGKYLPGSHIEVWDEEDLKMWQPEYVLILAWNLKEEIMKQLEYIRGWGGKFVVAIPGLEVL